MTTPARQIRAEYDAETITVYQAYSPEIALPAVRAGRFVPPFRMGRMTWIKPSFLWMMYRSGWAGKPGQEHVLAVRLRREGFERALSMACLSSFNPAVHGEHAAWRREKERCPVRVQWDPERSPDLQPLPWRAIQIGLSGPAVVNRHIAGADELRPDDPQDLGHRHQYAGMMLMFYRLVLQHLGPPCTSRRSAAKWSRRRRAPIASPTVSCANTS